MLQYLCNYTISAPVIHNNSSEGKLIINIFNCIGLATLCM